MSKTEEKNNAQKTGPRQAAVNVLSRVYGHGAYADIVLAGELEKVRPCDRGLTTEIVYGVLRRGMTIDWIIENISSIKIKKMERAVLMALRVGVYQIFFLSHVPDSASVNESVRLVRGQRKKGFVNAVLRKAADQQERLAAGPEKNLDQLTSLSITGSHPKWMVKRWLGRYGAEETAALLQANLNTPRKTLRTNTLRITREEFLRHLTDMGLRVTETLYSPFAVDIEGGSLPSKIKNAGLAVAQDEASQMVAMLLSPRAGEHILDACAAPGGKTTHMAQMMEDKGTIIAIDKYDGRLKSIEEVSKRLGISIITPICGDSEEDDLLREIPEKLFDAILVDAPCSGLGVLGRTPDIKLRRSEEDIKAIAKTQKRLLTNLVRFLRPGGRLVYSVCSLEPEETGEVVEFFLREQHNVCFEDASKILPKECGRLVDREGFLKTLPHRDHMDGFFAARFKKR